MGKVNNTNERNKMIAFNNIRKVNFDNAKHIQHAYLTVVINIPQLGPLYINSCKLIEWKENLSDNKKTGFVIWFPSSKDSDGQYRNVVFGGKPLTEQINNVFSNWVDPEWFIDENAKVPYGTDLKGETVWDKPDFNKKKEPEPVYDDELPF